MKNKITKFAAINVKLRRLKSTPEELNCNSEKQLFRNIIDYCENVILNN